jgi:cytochrome P450
MFERLLVHRLFRRLAVPFLLTGAARDPARLVARIRERDPVCWFPGFDTWLVTGYEDVRGLFSEPRLTADPRAHARYKPPTTAAADRWLAEMPFRTTSANPESLGRRLVMAALTPRAVRLYEARIREVVAEFAAPLRGRTDVVDLLGEFTAPASTTAIGRILGVPPKEEDEVRFRLLARRVTRTIRPFMSDARREKTEAAAVEMAEYLLRLVEQRHDAPTEDLLSGLARHSAENGRASDDDVVRVVAGLISAGAGTTGVSAARALRALFLHPKELAAVREDRSLLANGVDELLRYDSGLFLMPRYVTEDFDFRGHRFRKGQLVALSPFGANRDPRVFADPDRLDLRRNAKEALSFGAGPHYCPGANVARTEIRLMIEAALDFLPPAARLLDDRVRWSSKGLLGQIKSLPVDFGAGAERLPAAIPA